MAPLLRMSRRVAALGTVGLGLLLMASSASASDTFSLVNDSKVASLTGTSLWGKGHTMAKSCRTGPFPGPTLTSFTFDPGDQGSITLSQNPFSSCLSGINPLVDNPLTSPYLTQGRWAWTPDDPEFGFASLTCELTHEYGSQPVEYAVHGLACTISDPSPQSAGHFTSSAAPIRGGNAVAFVQHFPGTKAGASRGKKSHARYKLVLRDRHGKVYGHSKTKIVSGHGRKVRIPVSKRLRRAVAKQGGVKVKATIERIDGKRGSGDHEVITVMKDHRSLPF